MSDTLIKEKKDRKPNPYYDKNSTPPLEDDYSEESDPDSVCVDNSASWSSREGD